MSERSSGKVPDRALAPEKRGSTSDPGHPQPAAAEVESARLLANEAAKELRRDGYSKDEVRRLADEFIALDLGEGVPEFIAWVRNAR